jgi:acetolactate synthase-1/2/3 large subunit
MTQMTGGELLLKCLKEEGVSLLFGILDGSFNTFLAKLDEYEMRFFNPRHEAAAAHMAEAYARITGRPGVVIGGIGPGAANMVSGVITAYAEGTPLIVFSGQRRRNIIYPDRGGSFQNVRLIDLYEPVTKFSASVRDWRRLPEIIRKAYSIATNGRPGPVYIEIPEDVMRSEGDPADAPVWPAPSYRPTKRLPGDPELIQQAAELLANAERPFLHAGVGVSWSEAWAEFAELSDYLSAGMSASLSARGVVPEDHPRYFHPLNRDALERARSEADVVLVVGGRLGELDNWGKELTWRDPAEQTTIQIDIDPLSIGLNRPVDVGIVGDAKVTLAALTKAVQALTPAKPEHDGFKLYHSMTADYHQLLDFAANAADAGINSGKMIRQARDFFPRDAIFAMDGGNTSLWCANYNPIYSPHSYLYTAKFGHLGTGIPYAIGAKMAAPERPVYLISGDGAIGFNIQELETAVRYNLPITVIVACDQGWGMERSSQTFAGLDDMIECDLSPDVRYDKVAEAFGCHGEYVTALDDLQPALQRAVDSGKPALIQVMVDHLANMAPPGALAFGSMVYRGED